MSEINDKNENRFGFSSNDLILISVSIIIIVFCIVLAIELALANSVDQEKLLSFIYGLNDFFKNIFENPNFNFVIFATKLLFTFPPYLLWSSLSIIIYGFLSTTDLIIKADKIDIKYRGIFLTFRVIFWVFFNLFLLYRFNVFIYITFATDVSLSNINLNFLPILGLISLGIVYLIFRLSKNKLLRFLSSYWMLLIIFFIVSILYFFELIPGLLESIYPLDKYDFIASVVVFLTVYNSPVYFLKIYQNLTQIKMEVE